MLRRVVHRIRGALPQREYVRHRGHHLPAARMRQQMCGREFASDDFFLESGRAEAKRLIAGLGLDPSSRIVEIGSGLGRLAIGLLQEVGPCQYWGFDANAPWIAWCRKYIERSHPTYRFIHVDVANDLYNPAGAPLGHEFRFPLGDAHADIVYMWGVFTNMRLDDARIYIGEISRLLRRGGRAFLTAFVEASVAPESINPSEYVDYQCTVPLHVVRYDRDVLFSLFAAAGLTVEHFGHRAGRQCNQSEIYLRKIGNPHPVPQLSLPSVELPGVNSSR
jgi:SAM-dependent methyltransferase